MRENNDSTYSGFVYVMSRTRSFPLQFPRGCLFLSLCQCWQTVLTLVDRLVLINAETILCVLRFRFLTASRYTGAGSKRKRFRRACRLASR